MFPVTVTPAMVPNYRIEAETNNRHFADDIYKFVNEIYCILIQISLKIVP